MNHEKSFQNHEIHTEDPPSQGFPGIGRGGKLRGERSAAGVPDGGLRYSLVERDPHTSLNSMIFL